VALVLAVNLMFYKKYLNVTAALEANEGFSLKLFKPLMLLGLISFIAMGSEGAIVDWSGLYLKEVSIAPEALWGAGFLGFQITMTLGRFMGDAVSERLGSVKMIAVGTVLALVGYVLVLTENTYLAIAGFALGGLGFSVMIPEVFRIGGNVKGVDSSQGIAFIAGTGYAGFLCAPPILGFLAETSSLKTSFVALLGCAVIILGITVVLKKKQANHK